MGSSRAFPGRKALGFFFALVFWCLPAAADEAAHTRIGGYVELSYMDDRGMGWTGSETTLRPRAKLDLRHDPYDDITLRFALDWTPQVHQYSRAPGLLYRRETNPEDVYIHFRRFSGTSVDVRLGVVKVPFGQFDTLAVDGRNRPITATRTREWDMGARIDAPLSFMDLSFAVINGDGTQGTDANSSKSVALRGAFPASAEIYPETLEAAAYPNPLAANPSGDYRWQLGLSAYVGDRYTTPIKRKWAHYGADAHVEYGPFALKVQYTFFEGGYNNSAVYGWSAAQWDTIMAEMQYASVMRQTLYTYPRGQSIWTELCYAATEKSMLSVMAEMYDPDMSSNSTVFQRTKTRVVAGAKHDYRKGVTASLYYTYNDDPAFGALDSTGAYVDVTQSDPWKGDDVLMVSVAVQF